MFIHKHIEKDHCLNESELSEDILLVHVDLYTETDYNTTIYIPGPVLL